MGRLMRRDSRNRVLWNAYTVPSTLNLIIATRSTFSPGLIMLYNWIGHLQANMSLSGLASMLQTQEAVVLTAVLSQSFELCSIYNLWWYHAPLHLSIVTVWSFDSFRTNLNEWIIAIAMNTTPGLARLEFSYFAIIMLVWKLWLKVLGNNCSVMQAKFPFHLVYSIN